MSAAVRRGFNAINCGLVPFAAIFPGHAEKWAQDAIDGPTSCSDWNICGSCMAKLKPYLGGEQPRPTTLSAEPSAAATPQTQAQQPSPAPSPAGTTPAVQPALVTGQPSNDSQIADSAQTPSDGAVLKKAVIRILGLLVICWLLPGNPAHMTFSGWLEFAMMLAVVTFAIQCYRPARNLATSGLTAWTKVDRVTGHKQYKSDVVATAEAVILLVYAMFVYACLSPWLAGSFLGSLLKLGAVGVVIWATARLWRNARRVVQLGIGKAPDQVSAPPSDSATLDSRKSKTCDEGHDRSATVKPLELHSVVLSSEANMICFTCPSCEKSFNLRDEHTGRQGKCSCGAVITIPASGSGQQAVPEADATIPATKTSQKIALTKAGTLLVHLKCILGVHNWDRCKCTKCRKTRDQDHDWSEDCERCGRCGTTRQNAHQWDGCKCKTCGSIRHNWTKNCERCRTCGTTRTAAHDWTKDCEKCSQCGAKRKAAHKWDGCRCTVCGKETRKTYYDSGELRSEVDYKDGKEEGRAVVYYRGGDGKIEMVMHYKDGQLDGMYKKYDRAGKLRYECNYRSGVLHGSARHFDQAGIIMDETDFTNGQKGITREYDENGSLVS